MGSSSSLNVAAADCSIASLYLELVFFCLFFFVCLIWWHLKNTESLCHILGTVGKLSVSRGSYSLCFEAFGPIVWKLWIFELFLNKKFLKIKLNYLLFLKNHNSHIICPKAMKQSPSTPWHMMLSTQTKNTTTKCIPSSFLSCNPSSYNNQSTLRYRLVCNQNKLHKSNFLIWK